MFLINAGLSTGHAPSVLREELCSVRITGRLGVFSSFFFFLGEVCRPLIFDFLYQQCRERGGPPIKKSDGCVLLSDAWTAVKSVSEEASQRWDKDLLLSGGVSLNSGRERECEGGESVGSNRRTEQLHQELSTQHHYHHHHRSHLAVKVINLPQGWSINCRILVSLKSWIYSVGVFPLFIYLFRHLGFIDDVTSILNVMPLATLGFGFGFSTFQRAWQPWAFLILQLNEWMNGCLQKIQGLEGDACQTAPISFTAAEKRTGCFVSCFPYVIVSVTLITPVHGLHCAPRLTFAMKGTYWRNA